jgi:hypothetical protein
MNKPLETVWELVKVFTKKPTYVTIESFVNDLSKVTLEKIEPPSCAKDNWQLIRFELIANSVNYCYWYGSHNIRPNNAGAVSMYNNLVQSCTQNASSDVIINNFINRLSHERFPWMDKRAAYLKELLKWQFDDTVTEIENNVNDIEKCLDIIIMQFPGYSNDIFLKRTSLFFMQIARQSDLFHSQLHLLPVPADYQIPKMLEHMGILRYNVELKQMIENEDLIPSGSRIECEIRASTIEACRRLCEKSGKDPSTVDFWLWLNRKSCSNKFHLTITTDY